MGGYSWFSDFIVNEIDESGEVVWFRPETDLQKWKPANLTKVASVDSAGGAAQEEE